MKINGIDMEEACEKAFDKYILDTYGEEGKPFANEFDKVNKKTLFNNGFSACLEVLFKDQLKEEQC